MGLSLKSNRRDIRLMTNISDVVQSLIDRDLVLSLI